MKNKLTFLAVISVFTLSIQAQSLEWAGTIGGTGGMTPEYAQDLAIDSAGNSYIIGYFFGTADFDPGTGTASLISKGDGDIFFAKYDNDGNYLWAKSIGCALLDAGYAINVDNSGNVYTSGSFQETVDFNPGVGTFNLTSAGTYDIFVHKMSQTTVFSENELLKAIKVYPNPAQEYINLKTNSNEFTIEILNIVGQVLIREKSKKVIDIQTLSAGTYFVKVKTGEIEYQQKIIVY